MYTQDLRWFTEEQKKSMNTLFPTPSSGFEGRTFTRVPDGEIKVAEMWYTSASGEFLSISGRSLACPSPKFSTYEQHRDRTVNEVETQN